MKIKVLTHELLAFTLLSNANSLVILQSFKSLFTDSYVKFGLSLLLPITSLTYYLATNGCLCGLLLDMSKPSQGLLHKLLLDSCHP
jgi:hypothetical protein